MDIGGTSYNPADLMVEEGKVVTLQRRPPSVMQSFPWKPFRKERPANAVALLQYVYNERKVGTGLPPG